jgi:PUB domain
MSSNNIHPHYENGYHLQHITQVAPVDQYDASHGLFGELIDPAIVLQGLQLSDHVGRLDDPTAAMATQAMHSFLCSDLQEIVIEFDNSTPYPIVVRWLNEKGLCYPHFQFTLEAFSQQVQYSRLGHLFVLTIRIPDDEPEQLLGAYRIRMPLPSGSPHCVLVEPDPTVEAATAFHMEAMLADPQDALMVACASLDPVGAGPQQPALMRTIQTLHTILTNLQTDPDNPKFRSLRLSNPKVQKTIASSWGARQVLQLVGFRDESIHDEPHLVLAPHHQSFSRLPQALEVLESSLMPRSQPGFVAELAPTPPWQGPVLNSTTTSARAFGSGGTNFLSDDEKWARAERNRGRRGGGRRRPEPGNAPSSNGRWGR